MNINNMVKQVQKVQEQMSRVQEELADKTVEASSGGDMVRVVANGKQEIVTVQISPEAVDPKDISMETNFIEDLKADSMDQFFLIDGLCEKFDLSISDEDARKIQSIGDAVSYVENHK